MNCKKCGNPLEENQAFCNKCGTSTSDTKYVPPRSASFDLNSLKPYFGFITAVVGFAMLYWISILLGSMVCAVGVYLSYSSYKTSRKTLDILQVIINGVIFLFGMIEYIIL